jgi:hypothetical protein
MKGPGYPAGVPTPFVAHVHPYPTRFHGAIWTRPQFAFPQMQAPQSVFIPGRDIEMMPDKPYTGSGMQGLGELQYNVGDGIFKPGGYGGGVFDGNLSGTPPLGKRAQTSMGALGDAASDAVDYPWGAYSAKTAALQAATNVELKAAGYCPIAVDGKLGAATCGARDRLNIDAGTGTTIENPSTCQAYTIPTSASTGCGAGGGGTLVNVKPASQASMVSSSSLPMSSSTKKILGFLAGGVAAVAIVYVVKKRRR